MSHLINNKMRTLDAVIIGYRNITGLNKKVSKRIKPATHIGAIKKFFM